MTKKISLMFMFLYLFCGFSLAEVFKVSYISQTPKLIKAHNKEDGKFLWQSTLITTTEQHGDITMVRISEVGRGLWGGKENRQWKSVNIYKLRDGIITPIRSSIGFYDMKNTPTDEQEKIYTAEDHKVYVTRNGEKRSFDMESDLIDKEVLGTCLMNYPYSRENDFEFHMMTNEPAHYKMTMVNTGIESLTVNGRTIECYKLQMVPDLGFLGIFAPFVPKTYFWYEVKPPHEFVRYEGLESGLNTPYIVMEATD